LLEEAVGAVAVSKAVELKRPALGCLTVGDRVAIEEHLDRADVPREVAGIGVGLGELGRGDPRVVLGGVR
jgi:hypothetical protein